MNGRRGQLTNKAAFENAHTFLNSYPEIGSGGFWQLADNPTLVFNFSGTRF